MEIVDTFRHKGMRKKLVEELFEEGIKNEAILEAMEKIPRHLFMDSAFVDFAYRNQAFPISKDQTISQPYTVAFQTNLLDIQEGDRILEIGTGSGYQAAVLAELGVEVFSIERHHILHQKASNILEKLGYSVNCFYGDGFEGLPDIAPFDKVLITAAAPEMPKKLLRQLKVGGYLVIPYGEGEVQQMLRITKDSKTTYSKESFDNFRFVPMLKGVSK